MDHELGDKAQVVRHRRLENRKSGNLNFSLHSSLSSHVILGNLLNSVYALGSLSEKLDSYHLPCLHYVEARGPSRLQLWNIMCEKHFDYYGNLFKCKVLLLSINSPFKGKVLERKIVRYVAQPVCWVFHTDQSLVSTRHPMINYSSWYWQVKMVSKWTAKTQWRAVLSNCHNKGNWKKKSSWNFTIEAVPIPSDIKINNFASVSQSLT